MKISLADKIICDVCNKEILNFDNNNIFHFSKGWQSGIHKGILDQEGHVCNKCIKSKLRRWIAMKIFS
jgi:hypothetical protein